MKITALFYGGPRDGDEVDVDGHIGVDIHVPCEIPEERYRADGRITVAVYDYGALVRTNTVAYQFSHYQYR